MAAARQLLRDLRGERAENDCLDVIEVYKGGFACRSKITPFESLEQLSMVSLRAELNGVDQKRQIGDQDCFDAMTVNGLGEYRISR
jgi:hypothetical protein